jgi:predicted nucleotidyltransferase
MQATKTPRKNKKPTAGRCERVRVTTWKSYTISWRHWPGGMEHSGSCGSRARGDNRYNSDIDLAVYGMPESSWANFWMDCEELPTLLKFDIVHITDGMNPVFIENIKKDGVELYAAKD